MEGSGNGNVRGGWLAGGQHRLGAGRGGLWPANHVNTPVVLFVTPRQYYLGELGSMLQPFVGPVGHSGTASCSRRTCQLSGPTRAGLDNDT